MKEKRISRMLAILLAFMMVFTLIPGTALAEGGDESVSVKITVTDYLGGIEYFNENISISPGYAQSIDETYTYGDNITSTDVTFLDALAYVHHMQYGEDFKNNPTEYLALNNGMITKAFQNSKAYASVCLVNGEVPSQGETMYSCNQMKLSDNDFLEYYIMSDSSMGDYYTTFEKNGLKVSEAFVEVGTETGIVLKAGNIYSKLYPDYYGPYSEITLTNEENGIVVSSYNNHTLGELVEGITIGNDGQLTISDSLKSGTYEVAVNGVDDTGNYCLIPAYIKLYVINHADDVNVNVSISKNGEFVQGKEGGVIAAVPVRTSDVDYDGQITINDVLTEAHEEMYFGGASSGYATSAGSWGPYVSKLWGDTSGKFGYQLSRNGSQENVSGLLVAVQEGDYIDAYINESSYPDNENYAFFSDRKALIVKGEALTVNLKEARGYDESICAPIYGSCADATITVDGAEREISTNSTGSATVTFDTAGTFLLSAKKTKTVGDSTVTSITAPVLIVTVLDAEAERNITVTGTTFSRNQYTYNIPDQAYSKSTLNFIVTDDSAKEIKASVNDAEAVVLTSGKSKNLNIKAGTNVITISIVPTYSNRVTETYTYTVKRGVALKTMEVRNESDIVIPFDKKFNANNLEYYSKTVIGTKVKFNVSANGDTTNSIVKINGNSPETAYTILEGNNTFKIKLLSKDETAESKEYTVIVKGMASSGTAVICPEGTNFTLIDFNGLVVENPSPVRNGDGTETFVFSGLATGEVYTWVAGKYGYNATSGTFTSTADDSDDVIVNLTEAVVPTSSLEAEWKNFRNSDGNMAIVSVDTVTTAEETKLKWAQKNASATYSPGTYIIVDDKIVYTSGNKLSLIDKNTGNIVKSVTMTASRGYAYMPPVYGGGMIYVTLDGGLIQAFDAKTLESCWIYRDQLGGQALSTIMYDAGYIYTGFTSNNASKVHNFVCISAADENKESSTENKYATWTYKHLGGFYWSGAYINDNYVVVGGDNKALLVLDKKTGELKDSKSVDGDIRCAIAEKDGTLYFVTKGGSFYSATLGSNGKLTLAAPVSIGGESTVTPVIVNGYAYVGVKDKTVTQIKLSDGSVSKVATPAYSQSSILANINDENYTYLYFNCNIKPGGIEMITVNNSTGEMRLSTIFSPESEKQNYSISSVMCDSTGTLYYYNDSGNIFALEKAPIRSERYDLSFQIKDLSGTDISGASTVLLSMNGNSAVQFAENNGKYILSPGTYSYEIKKEGYKTATGAVTITNADLAVPISLQIERPAPIDPIEKNVSIQVIGYDGQVNYPKQALKFQDGMTALSVLQAVVSNLNWKNTQFGAYVVGIDGLEEFDYGNKSGWMYSVNGIFPDYSAGNYILKAGDNVVWSYTTNLGNDIGNIFKPENQYSVTTSGTAGSATTTTPAEVTVSGDTAKATIKTENAAEAIKQAKENKSAEIVIEVASADIKTADKVQVEITTATAKEILNTTTADLTVKTPAGTVTISQDALKEAVAEAKGTTITVEVAAVSKPTDIQKKAAGTNGQIISVTIKSGSTVISTFGGKSLKLKSEVPTKLKGKNIAAIHIAADGTVEKLQGKLVKEGTKEFYEFMTTHLSTFALVDADELGLEVNDEEANIEAVKKLVSAITLKASSSKTFRKNIKVTLTVDKDTAVAIKEIKDMGYTVKYKYYRSTKKASKYQAKTTKTTRSFTNTAGKKGTKYYYKARIQVYDKDGKLVAQTALKQCRYAARTWTK